MTRLFPRLLLLFAVLAAVAAMTAAAAWWYAHRPLALAAERADFTVARGMGMRQAATVIERAGVDVDARLLALLARLTKRDARIKAGSYEVHAGITPWQLILKLSDGDVTQGELLLVEGWTFRQVRQALARAEQLKPDSQGLSDADIMERLGRAGVPAEGRFFPDTYTYAKGSSDIAVLRRALHAMDRRLDAAWAQRAPDTPLQSADQALILASIVEKETGRAEDRAQIAGVFSNRLRVGMLLQTDPTVIYGLGEKFDGNLRRRDLTADTPYNTYTRVGLPPTPIAMPGKAALLAAVQPAPTKALYFVARGDGSSHFSSTLQDHNRAVNRYQRGQK